MSAERIGLDRIYQKVEATGGGIRALCDLFGMSVGNAARWASVTDGIDHRRALTGAGQSGPPSGS
jgi:hypothetical protein